MLRNFEKMVRMFLASRRDIIHFIVVVYRIHTKIIVCSREIVRGVFAGVMKCNVMYYVLT